MNTNNLIQVHTLTDNSSGYFFKSFDDEKSFVITSKHGICDQKESCDLHQRKVDGCCRACPKEFDVKDIKLLKNNDKATLQIEKIYYEKTKDLVIVSVIDRATDKLIINAKSFSDHYVSFGFNSREFGVTSVSVR